MSTVVIVVKPYRIALPLIAVLLSAGCIESDLGLPETKPPPPASAKPDYPVVIDEFVALLKQTAAASYSYTVDADLTAGTLTASGSFDAKARRLVTETRRPGTPGGVTRQLVSGDDSWVQDRDGGTWLHATRQQGARYVDLTDPTGLSRFTAGIKDVRGNGPNSYLGYLHAKDADYLPVGVPGAAQIVTESASVKFTATTGPDDRLTTIVIRLPGADPGTELQMTTTFSKHGEPVTVTAPKNAAEAP